MPWWLQVLGLVGCAEPQPSCRADTTAWADEDGDGFGGELVGEVCALGAGQVEGGLDCDDADPLVHPEAGERCNGLDDDCDGDPDQDLPGTRILYPDLDGDGFGAAFPSVYRCGRPDPDQAQRDGDCDDADPNVAPDVDEVCNGVDDDCDFFVDDGDDSVDPDSQTVWFRDLDGDGYGTDTPSVRACTDPGGFVDNPDDCAPEDPFVHPDEEEAPGDDIDQDCDGHDLCWLDLDRDEVGGEEPVVAASEVCDGGRESRVSGDCDDRDPTLGGAQEWYADTDHDGYGMGVSLGFGCTAPAAGAVGTHDDCAPSDPTVNPGAEEICDDAVDQDCDGATSCCPIEAELEEAGWPAYLDFDYCWSQRQCPYRPPAGAVWTLQQDGTYRDNQAGGGTWHVDQERCELVMRYSANPFTTYTGSPDGTGCYEGGMESGASWGTWSGCLR